MLASLSALAAVGLAWVCYGSLWAVLAPVTGVAIGRGFTLAASAAGAMATYPQHAGAASALAEFIQYVGVVGSVALIGLVFDGSALPVLLVIAGFAGLATLIFLPNLRVFSDAEPAAKTDD